MPAPPSCASAPRSAAPPGSRAPSPQHPEVGTGRKKELHFFDQRETYARGLEWYESQFRTGPRTRAVGEFTPNYWRTVGDATPSTFLGSAERVASAYPDLRLIVCLRDPVDRAVSAYFHNIKAGRLAPSVSLLDAVRERPGLRDFGRYATQLEAWLEHYPMERILFLVYEEDIRPDQAKPQALRRTFEHLGVDPTFEAQDLSALRNERLSRLRDAAAPRLARAPAGDGAAAGRRSGSRRAGRSPSRTPTGRRSPPTTGPRSSGSRCSSAARCRGRTRSADTPVGAQTRPRSAVPHWRSPRLRQLLAGTREAPWLQMPAPAEPASWRRSAPSRTRPESWSASSGGTCSAASTTCS